MSSKVVLASAVFIWGEGTEERFFSELPINMQCFHSLQISKNSNNQKQCFRTEYSLSIAQLKINNTNCMQRSLFSSLKKFAWLKFKC